MQKRPANPVRFWLNGANANVQQRKLSGESGAGGPTHTRTHTVPPSGPNTYLLKPTNQRGCSHKVNLGPERVIQGPVCDVTEGLRSSEQQTIEIRAPQNRLNDR